LGNGDRMSRAAESRVDRRRLKLWLGAVLFLGLFLYAWQGIQSHLLYYGFGVFTAYPVFSWDSSFLQARFSTPGGPVNAAAALLVQAYRSPALGALVMIAVAGVLFLGTQRLLRSMGAGKLRDLAWVPPILALMIYSRYDNPLPALLAIGLSLWMAILYGSVGTKTLPVRLGAFLVLFSLAYYLAGASALVLACIVCLTEALRHRRISAALAQAVLAGGAVFVLGRLAFGLGLRATFATGTPWDPAGSYGFSTLSNVLTVALYAFAAGLTLVAVLGGLLLRLGERTRPGRRGKSDRPAKPARQAGRWTADERLWVGVRMLVVAVTAVLCLALSRNHIRDERALHYYASQRDWDSVIALAHRMRGRRAFTRCGVFDINRALAHQGHLGDELCAYPQDDTRTLFLNFDDLTGRLQHAQLLELYLDLGCPNAAEKNAYELLDNEGPSPYVLEALVRIHLTKGQSESARIAFEALRRYVGGGPYLRQWQDVIADPARAASHLLLQAWRRVQGTADSAVAGVSFEPLLKRLLQDTPGHRLAFEYLMAHYLLKHQRAEFVRFLPLLRPLGYHQLPHQYAEAVLVHALETRTSPETAGWTIESDVQAQFREISGVAKNARGNNQAAFDALAPKYGDTYTFYSMFNVCGAR
jgi:hypothetical protein